MAAIFSVFRICLSDVIIYEILRYSLSVVYHIHYSWAAGRAPGCQQSAFYGFNLPAEAEHWKDAEFLVLPLLSLGLGTLDGARHSGEREGYSFPSSDVLRQIDVFY